MIRENIIQTMFKYILIFLFILVKASMLYTQTQDTISLPMAEIWDICLENKNPASVRLNNNFFPNKNITELLASISPVNIRNYGINSISMLTLQGGNAYQHNVLWDEVPLQNPMTGVFDFSSVPAFLFSNTFINTSNGSSFSGNQALNGSIEFKNIPKNEIQIMALAENINNSALGVKISNKKETFTHYTSLYLQQGTHTYKYINSNNQILNAQGLYSHQISALHENQWKINKKWSLNSKFWYNTMDRNNPYSMEFYTEFSQKQTDKQFRGISTLEYQQKNNYISIKYAYLNDQISFTPFYSETADISKINTHLSEIRYKKRFTKHLSAHLGSQIFVFYPTTLNYNIENKILIRNTYYLHLTYEKSLFRVNTSYRKEYFIHLKSPHIFSIDIEYLASQKMRLFSSISRNYRFPTLNDLFWQPGGNIHLLPEHSLKNEVGISFQPKNMDIRIKTFYAKTQQWIMWLPDGMFWTPKNIPFVKTMGLESSILHKISFKHTSIETQIRYFLTYARDMSSENHSYQLIFTPLHSSNIFLSLQHKHFDINYSQVFTSKKFISTDASSFIPAYSLSSVSVSYSWIFFKNTIKTSFFTHNVFNNAYYSMPQSPMPLRYYSFQILYTLKPFL